MGSPYLSTNESIILTTDRVKVDSILSDMILTNQRLLLAGSQKPDFRPLSIPLIHIKTVKTETGAMDEPILSLSILLPDGSGATKPLDLIFYQSPREKRLTECSDWVIKLKEQIAHAPPVPEPEITIQTLFGSKTAGAPQETHQKQKDEGNLPVRVESGNKEPIVTVFPFSGIVKEEPDLSKVTPQSSVPLQSRPVRSVPVIPPGKPAKTGKNRFLTAAIIIFFLAAAVIIGICHFTANMVPPVPHPAPTGVPTPVISPHITALTHLTTPVIPEPPTSGVTVSITKQESPGSIPQEGVWVWIHYDGSYTGVYGTAGRLREVTASGDHYYRSPTIDGILDAVIQKDDTSGKILKVGVYKNGSLLKESSTSAPKGTVDLHVNLKNYLESILF